MPARSDASRRKADVIARRAGQHRRAAILWNEHLGRVDRALAGTGSRRGSSSRRTPRRSRRRGSCTARWATTRWSPSCTRPSWTSWATPRRPRRARRACGSSWARSRSAASTSRRRPRSTSRRRASSIRSFRQSLEIAEKLAEVYASPNFRDGQTRHKAGELFVEVGRRRPRLARRRDGHQLPAPRGGHRSVLEGLVGGARGGAVGRERVGGAGSHPAPPERGGAGSGRARLGPAPAGGAVSKPAAEPRGADRRS